MINLNKGILMGLCLLILGTKPSNGQLNRTELDKMAMEQAMKSWDMFYELLSIPNDAHFPDFIEKNVVWCEKAFTQRGFSIQRLATPTVPILLAERKIAGAEKTVLIYLQIDGQPADPKFWAQKSPWIPVLKTQDEHGKWVEIDWENLKGTINPDWRIFARSASDAKGPAIAFLAALDAAERAGISPNYNMKVVMDFEEELGSPHLTQAVFDYKDALMADMMIIYDGPMHLSNEPTLSYGARGIATIALTTYGPRVPQHSGHYGNYAPNPAFQLSDLLADMKDEYGRVKIEGWYDGIELTPEEIEILKHVPDDENEIRRNIGIGGIDSVGRFYQEAIQYPSLNIRGMASGWVGSEARTIIPSTARADLDIRLVPDSDPEKLISLLKDYIRSKGFLLLDDEPTEAQRLNHYKKVAMEVKIEYLAFQTPMNSETGLWLSHAIERAFDKSPIRIRMMGGSIPISPFVSTLGIPAVAVPTVNPDNNQHSPNENIRLGNFVDAIKTYLAILEEKL
jgi:acetylornithine deacetylase/succinyl-diaminopimelate desuccinylase-like protein